MYGTYEISTRPSQGLLRIRLSGFFSRETLERFSRERVEAIRSLGLGANQHLTIVDVSDCNLQSQEAVAAFAAIIADPNTQSRRCAFVTGSSVALMQLRRMIVREETRCFEAGQEAEAWLLDRGRAAA